MTRPEFEEEYATSSLRQMAERRGVSWQWMQQLAKKLGVTLRPRGGDSMRFYRERAA